MRFIALHYHIFKNAGSTLERMLARSFGSALGHFEQDDRDVQLSAGQMLAYLAARPDLRAVTSHQLRYPKPAAPGYVFFDLCFLRDPIDRLRSIYDFCRQGAPGADPLRALAHAAPLAEFLAGLAAHFPHVVNNPQVTFLATDGAYRRPAGPADLERAARTMREMSFPGVVDRFDESFIAGRYFWQPVFPDLQPAAAPVNVTGKAGSTLDERLEEVRRACGRRLYRELLDLNELDLELLRQTRREVRRRFELVPDHAGQLAALRAQGEGAPPAALPLRRRAARRLSHFVQSALHLAG
jgi:hypothetical protein